MEQNLPIITKKLCNMVKLAIYMLRKGISKKKLLLDLNLMTMKRGKTGFTTDNDSTTRGGGGGGGALGFDVQREYKFSYSNTPLYRLHFTNKKKNHQNSYYMPSPKFEESDDSIEAISKVLETMLSRKDSGVRSRRVRVTDSPYPLQNEGGSGDQLVDEAAEKFIQKFYLQLKEKNCY